ncbi:MAG: hypothetical protein QOI06_3267 [Nocardioidaceae bacterium]|jgi:DNA-binding transcriptional MerR regulator|nr:hypothetical protein [Nocardioidaceae bacterium]
MSSSMPVRPAGRMSIGEVLRRLRDEFPDVSISKIRFLESEGLIEPERTPSGYRKFTNSDLERLRYVLASQRDHYLPLKVIREHLDAMARGMQPPAAAGQSPRAPQALPVDGVSPVAGSGPELRMSRGELIANSGLSDGQLDDLEQYGLVRTRTGSADYDGDALTIATTVAALAGYGLEPRHLRVFKTAADREAGLIEQVVMPVARQRDHGGVARAEELRIELAALATRLRGALVAVALKGPR